jgi:hypothetical protein
VVSIFGKFRQQPSSLATAGFQDLARDLNAAGLQLPTPLERALQSDLVAVAVGSRESWAAWAAGHG